MIIWLNEKEIGNNICAQNKDYNCIGSNCMSFIKKDETLGQCSIVLERLGIRYIEPIEKPIENESKKPLSFISNADQSYVRR